MKYTKKDLITRFLKTYWIFCIAVLFLIYGFVLISFCPSSSVWYPIGMALVATSIAGLVSGYQIIENQRTKSEDYLIEELFGLSKKLDAVFIEGIKSDRAGSLTNDKKYDLLVKLSKYLNVFFIQLGKLEAKRLLISTFMDFKIVNYLSVLKCKVDKEIKNYSDDNFYNIDWEKIYNLFVEVKEETESNYETLEYLNGIESCEIDKIKPSFWTCLNIKDLISYKAIGSYFYRDNEKGLSYYSKVIREINAQDNSLVYDFLRLFNNVNYTYEDPEISVWKKYKGEIKNINVYDYADLVYSNLDTYYNGNIDTEKAIRTLRNVKVQLQQSKYVGFRKEALDIVIERLKK